MPPPVLTESIEVLAESFIIAALQDNEVLNAREIRHHADQDSIPLGTIAVGAVQESKDLGGSKPDKVSVEILYRANPTEAEDVTDDTANLIKQAVLGCAAVAGDFSSTISYLALLEETLSESREDTKSIRKRTLSFQILIAAT